MENFIAGLAVGMFVWLFTWGMNRVYLTFKSFVS
jgi:hypothetical protein